MLSKLKALVTIIFLCTLIISIPLGYQYWPNGKAKDYAFVFFNSDELLSLMEYLNATSIERVMWCGNEIVETFIRSGKPLSDEQINDDDEV